MARLRDPQRGCPWDREQTFATIAPYTIEEAYEVADAIERDDRARAARRARRSAVPGGVSRAHGAGARLRSISRDVARGHQRQARATPSARVRRRARSRAPHSRREHWEDAESARAGGRARAAPSQRARRRAAGAARARTRGETRAARGARRVSTGRTRRACAPRSMKSSPSSMRRRTARGRCGGNRSRRRGAGGRALLGGEPQPSSAGRSGGSAARGQPQVRAALSAHGSPGHGPRPGSLLDLPPRPGTSCGSRPRRAARAPDPQGQCVQSGSSAGTFYPLGQAWRQIGAQIPRQHRPEQARTICSASHSPVSSLLGLLLSAQTAVADDDDGRKHGRSIAARQSRYDYAQVVDVDPIVRQVRVRRRSAWSATIETRYEEPVGRAPPAPRGVVILGGLIGGVHRPPDRQRRRPQGRDGRGRAHRLRHRPRGRPAPPCGAVRRSAGAHAVKSSAATRAT